MSSAPSVLNAGKPPSKTFLIVTTIIFAVIGLLAVPGSFVAMFAFDAPGSEKSPFLWGAVLCMFSLPVICPLSILAGWLLHAWRKYKAARYAALAPLCSILGFALMVVGALVFEWFR
jgi:hypothetical protein